MRSMVEGSWRRPTKQARTFTPPPVPPRLRAVFNARGLFTAAAFREASMSACRPLTLLAALAAAAGPAVAQETPPPSPETDVVVTGTLERDQEIRDFVGALTPGPASGQIARFEDAICPGVFGMSGAPKEAILTRMRRVAGAAGLRLAPEGRCTPNVLLMVTQDKQAFIRRLAGRYPAFFGDGPGEAPRDVAAQPGPASAWHARALLDADGQALPMQGGFSVNRTTRRASRITAAARPVFVAAAVVVERESLTGLSTTQLADYALMRALAATDPHRLAGTAQPSILSVLEAAPDSVVPTTLTRWDLGFLRGLYASRPNLFAGAQRSEIGRSVGAELQRGEGPGR